MNLLRDTEWNDIEIVAEDMREEDVMEVKAASGLGPRTCLIYSYGVSNPMKTMLSHNQKPIAIGGVVPDELNPRVGQVWMLGTNAMVDDFTNRHRFLRNIKTWVADLDQQYDVLWNYMDARNTMHKKWLHWMGFTFTRKQPNYGTEGRLFLEFCKVTHHV